MTSQLAKQLHRLQDRPTNDAKLSKSFLFSNADAKQITREQVHELAIAGLRILMTIDNRLNIFLEPLFAASLIRKERAMYTTEENEVLNNHLRKLCVMLSPHLFLTAAQQVMEYLVRIFEVHTYNVKIVLSMFLPYHDHAIFTRALMLLDLRGSGFDFLQKNQLNGAVLPRQTLNIAAGENGKVMRLVCNVAADCIKYDVKNNGAFALFTGVATAVSTRADNEAVMRILLPYVVTFIDEPSPIATPAALIVLHTWCTEASLSTLTLAAILRPLIAGLNRSDFHVPLSEIIAVLGHVFLTQKVAIHDVAFTPILTILLSLPWGEWWANGFLHPDQTHYLTHRLLDYSLVQLNHLGATISSSSDVCRFLVAACRKQHRIDGKDILAIFNVFCKHCSVTTGRSSTHVKDINKPSSKNGAMSAADNDERKVDDLSSILVNSLKDIERRFPTQFDYAVAEALRKEANEEQQSSSSTSVVVEFISKYFVGTKFELISVNKNVSPHGKLPILSCLLHHVPEVRSLAFKNLQSQLLGDNKTANKPLFLKEVEALRISSEAVKEESKLIPLLVHAIATEESSSVAMDALMLVDSIVTVLDYSPSTAQKDDTYSSVLFELMSALWQMISSNVRADIITGHQSKKFADICVKVYKFETERIAMKSNSSPKSQVSLKASGIATSMEMKHEGQRCNAESGTICSALALYYLACLASSSAEQDGGDRKEDFINTLDSVVSLEISADNSLTTNSKKNKADRDTDSSDDDNIPVASSSTVTNVSYPFAPSFIVKNVALLKSLLPLKIQGANALFSKFAQRVDFVRSLSVPGDTNVVSNEYTSLMRQNGRKSIQAEGAVLMALLVNMSIFFEKSLSSTSKTAIHGVHALVTDTKFNEIELNRTIGRALVASMNTILFSHREHGDMNYENIASIMCLVTLELSQPIPAFGLVTPSAAFWRLVSPVNGKITAIVGNHYTAQVAAEIQFKSRKENGYADTLDSQESKEKCSVALFKAVMDSVYRPPNASTSDDIPLLSDSSDSSNANLETADAIAFALLLPSMAPTPKSRQEAAEMLQSVVIRRMTGGTTSGVLKKLPNKKKGYTPSSYLSPIELVIQYLLKSTPDNVNVNSHPITKPLSITGINSLVEVIADIRNVNEFSPMTDDAAKFVASLLVTIATNQEENTPCLVPNEIVAQSVRAVFAPSGQVRLPFKQTEMILSTFAPFVEKVIFGSGVSSGDAQLLDVIIGMLSLSGVVKSPTISSSLSIATKLLKKGFVRVAGESYSAPMVSSSFTFRPLYLPVLRALASVKMPTTTALSSSSLGANWTDSVLDPAALLKDMILPLYDRGAGSRETAHHIVTFLTQTPFGFDTVLCEASVELLHRAFRTSKVIEDEGNAAIGEKRSRGGNDIDSNAARHQKVIGEPEMTLLQITTLLDLLADVFTALSSATAPSLCNVQEGSSIVFGASQVPHIIKGITICKVFDALSQAIASGSSLLQDTTSVTVQLLHLLRVVIMAASTSVGNVRISPKTGSLIDVETSQPDDDNDDSSESALTYIVTHFEFTSLAPYFTGHFCTGTEGKQEDMNALVEYTTTSGTTLTASARSVVPLSALDTIQALISAILGNGVTSLGAKRAAVVRHSLLHHGLSLITHIFSLDGAEFDAEMLIPIISQLLHAMAPVLSEKPSSTELSSVRTVSFLHIPIIALFLKLDQNNDQFRSTLQFEDPVHICLRIIGSFPIDDQMMCLSGMMNLVCDPEKHIAQELQREGVLVNENDVSVKLCRKLIKTGKIANRQEPLLNLITLAVKSDNFLEPFVELQHNSAKNTEAALNSEGKKKNLKELRNDKEETEEDAQQRKTGGELMTLKGHQRWSELLVSCLNLYSHYHNLNSQVEDNTYISSVSVGDDPVWDPEDIPSEDKAFTILLELLAGNCLACLLAAINEPTFVDCQLKLLKSPNTSLQRKGIETLMDRLHQSLPTTENQMTEEVAATKAENLKDPKVKLHPAQLFELRARPLTTKRSVVLLPHIMAILKRELLIVGETLNKKEKSSLLKESTSFIQLCASSIEELVRIIGGGGSNKAERELLRIQRIGDISGKGASAAAGFMMTEAVVAKLFGSKASVSLIHNYVNDLLDLLKALQAPLIQASSSSVGVAMRSQGCILAITSITAVSTVIRTLGVAFSTPHANRVLSTISIWMEAIMTISASGANEVEGQGLLRRVLLLSVIHMLPNTWTMIHPYVATFLSFATHNVNAYDGETTQEASDLLILLKGVLGHRSVLECICSALSPGATQEQGVFSARRITPHTHNLRIVYHFVNMMLTEMTKDEIESMPVLISNNRSTNFWISSFASLASTTGSAAAANEIPSIESMEPIFEAYCTFFVKFREKKCLKLLSQILEWVMSSSSFSTGGAGAIQRNKRHRVEDNKDTINEEEEDTEDIPEELYQEDGYTKHQLHQQLVFLSFYCYILKKMKGVIDFTFPLVCPLLVELLGRYNPTPFTLLSETGAEPVGSWVLRRKVLLSRVMYANQSLLNAVRLMSEESTPEADISAALAADRVFFARKDTYNAVMPLLVAQLSNISVLRGSSADYGGDMSILERAQRTIIPSLRTFFNCLSSPNLWSQTQKEILKMLRHPHFEVRKATLQTLQYIYRDGGDQLCALIVAEALPGIVEMTEDANRAVMEQARSLCNELSAITGQDVLHAMS